MIEGSEKVGGRGGLVTAFQRVHGGIGAALALGALAACVLADVLLDHEAGALVGTYVAAPLLAALFIGPAGTAGVAALALIAALASPAWNVNTDGSDQLVRLIVIAVGGAVAIMGALARTRSYDRSQRLSLLDAVGHVADGSLPLGETLSRVTEVIVPMLGDICIVDAVAEGRATRLAVRAAGRADSDEIERRLRERPPTLPRWLVEVEPSWRNIPRWMPRMGTEDIRRLAHSEDDLEFLESLEVRSSISAPIRARDRNLGVLTLIGAWSGRTYSSDDVHYAQILASRIGLALDNAGLFSDLESVERRMDTVMSLLDEAVVIHGVDGELVYANPAAARSLGFGTSEEAISRSSLISERLLIRGESGEELDAGALSGRSVLAGAGAMHQTLRVTERATGVERWYRTKARAVRGPKGEVIYSVTALEDVTDVKRAEFVQRLLGRTGELVSHSTDYLLTLERVPRLIVPEFADWCSVEMPAGDGTIERVATAHRDPARGAEISRVRRRFPVSDSAASPIARAMATGEAQLVEVNAESLREVAAGAEHQAALEAMELASVIVAPMFAGGETVGVLTFANHVGSRLFDSEDVRLAVELARRAGLAIENARVADERRRVAEALQRELLPPSLPRMEGWQVATMYEPAGEVNEVGGDFYEVFEVAEGWAVVLGDVSGKGAAAAALTAEARHTIRTAGILSADPCAGLDLLNAKLRERRDAALCSVAIVVLPATAVGSCEVVIYLAGHPHPILLGDAGPRSVGEPGPMLGVVDSPRWEPSAIRVGVGDQLVLYTDGVIEAQGDGQDRFGTERLRLGLAGSRTPEQTVGAVRAALSGFGARAQQDDAAVVAIRRRPSPEREPRRLELGDPVMRR